MCLQEAAAAKAKDDELQKTAEARGEKAYKKRGRPAGSKTKPRPEDLMGEAATAQEAIHRMIASKKLSKRINYDALDELLNEPGCGPPCLLSMLVTAGCTMSQHESSVGEAATAQEAIHRMISSKKLSKRINHDALDELLNKPGCCLHCLPSVSHDCQQEAEQVHQSRRPG